MYVLGIDPGLKGGLCFFKNNNIVAVLQMPIYKIKNKKGSFINLRKVSEFIEKYKKHKNNILEKVYIEKQFLLRSQGMSSGSKTMYQAGLLYGLCFNINDKIELEEINAKDWQKYIFSKIEDSEIKNSKDTKIKSITYVKENYGDKYLYYSNRQRKPSDGLADAICIAKYGYTQSTTKNNEKNYN